MSKQAKDNIVEVFAKLGGVPAMTKWAKANKEVFYTRIYARLIPKDVTLNADAGLEELLTQLAERQNSSAAPVIDAEFVEVTE